MAMKEAQGIRRYFLYNIEISKPQFWNLLRYRDNKLWLTEHNV